jgi:Tol biopolymer transport system component
MALSPDGTRLAYVSAGQIWLRAMDGVDIKPVLPAKATATILNLTFSPDGQWLAYSYPQDVYRVPAAGGVPVRVHEQDVAPFGMTWQGDSLLMASRNKVVRIGANGGEVETLIELPADKRVMRPQLLPDGRSLVFGLFAAVPNSGGTFRPPVMDIVAQRMGEPQPTVLVKGADDPQFVAPGHLLFVREGVLYATAFNPATFEVSKDSVPVLPGIRRNGPWAQYAVAASGVLSYVPGPLEVGAAAVRSLILSARDGTPEYLKPASGEYDEPRMSPDRRYIAYVNIERDSQSIWVYDRKSGGAARRLTFGGRDRAAVWTPDSSRVTFQSERNGIASIYSQRADGSGVAEQLTTAPAGVPHTPQSWSPDGSVLLLDVKDKGRYTLMMMRARDKSIVPFAQVSSISETGALFSPNGKWIAYTRDETDAPAMVFVQPFPATGAQFEISKSTEDGHHPIWSADGRELWYTPGSVGVVTAVPLQLSPEFVPGDAVRLPRPFTNLAPTRPRSYDAAEGGKILGLTTVPRNLAPVQAGTASPRIAENIHIVINWLEELRAKVKPR